MESFFKPMPCLVANGTVRTDLTKNLPRLLYFSDVPPASTFHGSALIYRLLEDYPTDRLLVIESGSRSAPETRLPGVNYREFRMRGNRSHFRRSPRFLQSANSWLMLRTAAAARGLARSLTRFSPDAVLTISHGYSWLVAARFAENTKLPLHVILHDAWPPTLPVLPLLRSKRESVFARVYRQAASRLCVSPFMEEHYRELYGVCGQVLYPSWAKNVPPVDNALRAYDDHRCPLTAAYAGNIWNKNCARLIGNLAERLEVHAGRLLLFGPFPVEAWGLNRRNIVHQGLVNSPELISRLRAEADFVFVPMSFEDRHEPNVRTSFPSKLTDYTVAGLPLLICGPDYSSAVRWARQHSGVAEVVTSDAAEDLDRPISRLQEARYRERLGRTAREIGDRLFSHSAAMKIFRGALLAPF